MRLRELYRFLALPLVLLCAAGAANAAEDLFDFDQLIADGWEVVAPGVMQKVHDDGRIETLGLGAEGLEWRAAKLQAELAALEQENLLAPTIEVADALDSREKTLARVLDTLDRIYALGATEAAQQVPSSCDVQISQSASAGPGTGGPTASSNASFSNTCGYIGNVDCFARAKGTATQTTETIQTHPDDGTSASCTAGASVTGTSACISEAEACVDVNYPGEFVYFRCEFDSNLVCRNIGVSILGPSLALVPNGTCRTLTWSASVSNGPASSFTWRRNGIIVGSGSSYSRSYCASGLSTTFVNDTIAVTVSGGGSSASASRLVRVTLEGRDFCDDFCCVQAQGGGTVESKKGTATERPVCPIEPIEEP